jgi:hypothetical protein
MDFVIPIRNRTRKPLVIALSGVGRGLRERDDGSNVTSVQYKLELPPPP